MVGLTAHTLIRDWEQPHDSRLIPALRLAADWMWANAWIPRDASMWEDSRYRSSGAPDANLLIAPIYAFLYWQTGDTKYRDQGDQIFAGGVTGAWLGDGKHFNHNYWWSFDYVKWRTAGPVAPSPPAPPTLSISPQTSVDFGSVAVGQSADRSFTVTNTGGSLLTGTA